MEIVILTAFGVGGATVFGAVIGLIFRGGSKTFNESAMPLAAGIMLAAAMLGLIFPSLEYGGRFGVAVTIIGIFLGALCVNLTDLALLKFFDKRVYLNCEMSGDRIRRAFLFVMAIAIHNLPEGIAAGVGFGAEDSSSGFLIATAIALQNIPEGMAVIVAMLDAGMKKGKTFFYAAMTGVVEIFGTLLGFYTANVSKVLLPFVLAFAGGNMLYVIADEMIPSTRGEETSHRAAYLILSGFCLMLILDAFI